MNASGTIRIIYGPPGGTWPSAPAQTQAGPAISGDTPGRPARRRVCATRRAVARPRYGFEDEAPAADRAAAPLSPREGVRVRRGHTPQTTDARRPSHTSYSPSTVAAWPQRRRHPAVETPLTRRSFLETGAGMTAATLAAPGRSASAEPAGARDRHVRACDRPRRLVSRLPRPPFGTRFRVARSAEAGPGACRWASKFIPSRPGWRRAGCTSSSARPGCGSSWRRARAVAR